MACVSAGLPLTGKDGPTYVVMSEDCAEPKETKANRSARDEPIRMKCTRRITDIFTLQRRFGSRPGVELWRCFSWRVIVPVWASLGQAVASAVSGNKLSATNREVRLFRLVACLSFILASDFRQIEHVRHHRCGNFLI